MKGLHLKIWGLEVTIIAVIRKEHFGLMTVMTMIIPYSLETIFLKILKSKVDVFLVIDLAEWAIYEMNVYCVNKRLEVRST